MEGVKIPNAGPQKTREAHGGGNGIYVGRREGIVGRLWLFF